MPRTTRGLFMTLISQNVKSGTEQLLTQLRTSFVVQFGAARNRRRTLMNMADHLMGLVFYFLTTPLIGHLDAIPHLFFPSKSLYRLFPPPPVFKHIESSSSDEKLIVTPDQIINAQEDGSINGSTQAQLPKPGVRLNPSTNSTRRFSSLPLFFNPKSHAADQENDHTGLHVQSAQVDGTEVETSTFVENRIHSTAYSEPAKQNEPPFSDFAEEESSLFSLPVSNNVIFESRDSNNVAPTSPNQACQVGNSTVSNEPIRFPDITVFPTTPEWAQLKKNRPAPPILSFPSMPNWHEILMKKSSLPGKQQTLGNKQRASENQPAPPIPSFPSIPNWREIAINKPSLPGKRQSSVSKSHNIYQSDRRKETS